MGKMSVHFSSATDNWSTPEDVYLALDKEFNFDYDPCPLHCKEFNGLETVWGKSNFVNPPYSNLSNWIIKAWMESKCEKIVVMLIPSRTDTRAFHDYILKYAKEIRFIKGRLKFGGAKNSAPFPSCIVIFQGDKPCKE